MKRWSRCSDLLIHAFQFTNLHPFFIFVLNSFLLLYLMLFRCVYSFDVRKKFHFISILLCFEWNFFEFFFQIFYFDVDFGWRRYFAHEFKLLLLVCKKTNWVDLRSFLAVQIECWREIFFFFRKFGFSSFGHHFWFLTFLAFAHF